MIKIIEYHWIWAATSFCSASVNMLPYTITGHSYTKPPKATKLYFGCQAQVTKGPFISKFEWSVDIGSPVTKSHKYGLPDSEGLSKYLLSGETAKSHNWV